MKKKLIKPNNKLQEESNYYVTEELEAEDIVMKGTKYAENATEDGQILFLVTKDAEKVLEHTDFDLTL